MEYPVIFARQLLFKRVSIYVYLSEMGIFKLMSKKEYHSYRPETKLYRLYKRSQWKKFKLEYVVSK